MKNFDKLMEMARDALLNHDICEMEARTARSNGDEWKADMLDLDAKIHGDEMADFHGSLMAIFVRAREIADFENQTGVEFDALHMHLPDCDLMTWWHQEKREVHSEAEAAEWFAVNCLLWRNASRQERGSA